MFFLPIMLWATAAHAHCTCKPLFLLFQRITNISEDRFPKLIIDGKTEAAEWTSIRQTKNYQANFGVTSVSSADMRCFQNKPGTGTATVTAGSVLGFVAAAEVSHFGPVQFYMAKVPDSANINTWEAAGNVWFKAASISAVQGNGPLTSDEKTWPAYSM
jgi:hypothetical protein